MKGLMYLRFLSLYFLLFFVMIDCAAAKHVISDELLSDTEPINSPLHLSYQSQQEYQIWAGDVLDLRVLGHPELEAREIRVDERGLVRLPQIDGEIRATCLTVKELKAKILSQYRLLSNEKYQISLQIVEYNSPLVTFEGAVRVQRLRLRFRTRLLEVLSMAGGPAERAKGIIEIRHHSQSENCLNSALGKNTITTYNIKDIKDGNDESNPYLYPGDVIKVPESERVYVTGAVAKAGDYLLDEADTVSKAIDRAGGLSLRANSNRIEICRRVKNGKGISVENFFVDLESIKRNAKDDLKLQPNDFIYVFSSYYTNGTCKNLMLGLPPTGTFY